MFTATDQQDINFYSCIEASNPSLSEIVNCEFICDDHVKNIYRIITSNTRAYPAKDGNIFVKQLYTDPEIVEGCYLENYLII